LLAATGANSFSVSPDGLTIYTFSSATIISRFTYSGTYNPATFTYSGGVWSAASTGFSVTGGAISIAVDWTGYAFSTSANGAKIYACSGTNLVTGNDNGTGAITTTTLRTVSGNNAFRGLAFSPVKQTISKGANTPAVGSIAQGIADTPLFQFNLSADEGNSTLKKIVFAKSGTATIATATGADITTFKLILDADNSGTFNGGDTNLGSGSVSGSTITFSSITLPSYINEGLSQNFLVVGTVDGGATATATISLSVASTNTINTIAYTSNVVNAGGSLVTMGTSTSAPSGNTLTISGGTPTIVLSSPSQVGANASISQGTTSLVLSQFQADVTVAPTTINTVAFTTGGTYSTSDLVASSFKLYYNTSNSIPALPISTQAIVGTGNIVTFGSLSQSVAIGTGYFWITTYSNYIQCNYRGS
jgi:hypothetical protein